LTSPRAMEEDGPVTALDTARAHLEAGDWQKAREAASEGLASNPDDAELLRVAGRAGVEVGADDAVDQLRRVTELEPDSGEAWRDLGDALAAEGRTDESADAFRKAVELNPDDEVALTALGHAEFAAGKGEGALGHLEQAAERTQGMSTAAISLVQMYKAVGQTEEALAAAEKVAEADPDDVAAALDIAELTLELGRLDDARQAFERIREMEDLPDHEVYALHGMILVELKRDQADRALELAREAARVDEYGRTAGVLAHLDPEEAEDEAAEPPPSREEVESALNESLREHRRLHAEDRRLLAEDLLG
jgi:tetratricopeptide (TPR) repeat protein